MIIFKRLLMAFVLVSSLTACASNGTNGVAGRAADPRTMSFPPLKFEIPKSQRSVLGNGMIVYMLEDHDIPLVNITAYIRTGSIYDPSDKAGLAGIVGAALRNGGTADTPPEKLDAELEFMASAIESSIGTESGNVSMATLAKNLDRTMDLFSQVLMSPLFRQDRMNLIINNTIESLRRQNDDPKGIADRELRKALYAGHPLGSFPTIDSVQKVTRDDLKAFHKRYFHPNNIILAVSGDFNSKDLLKRLEERFGGWLKEEVAFPYVPEPASGIIPENLFVRKEVSQSVVRMGDLGIDKNNPELYAVRIMDYILGGGFTSRLVQEIRSNQGLAYNVDSNFDVGRRFIGTFVAETETKSESTVRTITYMRDIIAGMKTAPVSDQELTLAKDAIINSFIFGFTKPDMIVNQQVRLEFFGYPPGYLENYRDNMARVTADDVLRVSRKYLHPDRMILMVVGDDKNFDKPLSSLGPAREIRLEPAR